MRDCADDGDGELTDRHTEGAPEKERSAPESLNGPERDGSREYVDESRDERY